MSRLNGRPLAPELRRSVAPTFMAWMRSAACLTYPLVLISALAACASPDRADRGDTATGGAARPAASEYPAPRTPAGDSATAALQRFLELSREGAAENSAALDSLMGCQMGDGMHQPIEMLAAYEVTGHSWRGDTAVARARVITTAEEDGDPREADRFVAMQRVRRGEWEWDVVREGDRWHVCNGPRFGFWGDDSNTAWRPAGASSVSARALADSVWRASRP